MLPCIDGSGPDSQPLGLTKLSTRFQARTGVGSRARARVDRDSPTSIRCLYHWRKEVIQDMNDSIAGSTNLEGEVAES